MPEPGRRVIAAERAWGRNALPWDDPGAFARKALLMAKSDLKSATGDPVFFDRGMIDAAVDLLYREGIALTISLGGPSPYDDPVFLAPPWPEIYGTDADRRHGLTDSIGEFYRLQRALADLGHHAVILPQIPVADRCAFVLRALT